jgi:hypothetical protein
LHRRCSAAAVAAGALTQRAARQAVLAEFKLLRTAPEIHHLVGNHELYNFTVRPSLCVM